MPPAAGRCVRSCPFVTSDGMGGTARSGDENGMGGTVPSGGESGRLIVMTGSGSAAAGSGMVSSLGGWVRGIDSGLAAWIRYGQSQAILGTASVMSAAGQDDRADVHEL